MLQIYHTRAIIEAGCDEAGRGCLAGPVFAAAVILPGKPSNKICELLQDSKKLSAKDREIIYDIVKQEAVAWSVAAVDNDEIDKINILNASILAMHKALDGLAVKPERLIIDGNQFKKYKDIPYNCIVNGDGTYMSIAAASIIAKITRDKHMISLHKEYPDYDWIRNKGYPTPQHKEMVRLHGLSPYHRKTFKIREHALKGLSVNSHRLSGG